MENEIKETWEERSKREKNEEIAHNEELRPIAMNVLFSLGYNEIIPLSENEMEYFVECRHVTCKNSKGYLIRISWGSIYGYWSNSRDKFTISSAMHSDMWKPVTPKEINVSVKKSVDSIVKDIKRRFLPDFETYCAAVNVYEEEKKKNSDLKKERFFEICRLLGKEEKLPSWRSLDNPYDVSISNLFENGYGDIIVNGGDSFDIKLRSLGYGDIIKIVSFLKDIRK